MMNQQQEQAATQLLRAFRKCAAAGLSAAILDQNVCVWPREIDLQSDDDPLGKVDEVGRSFTVQGMWIDGGAGA
jgi:hypothetical protein